MPGRLPQIIEFLAEDGCADESENWNQRYRDNLNKLRVGDIYGVADVVNA
jgi:RNA polymerase-interacting CarD/CdnL/TRCF family regulator